MYEFPPFKLDEKSQTLYRGWEEIARSKIFVKLLQYLVQNNGQMIPYTDLFSYLWPGNREVDAARFRAVLRDLRQTLHPHQDFIETDAGSGVRLVCPVLRFEGGGFLGRRELLIKLRSELNRRPVITLVAFNGMGKSELAWEYGQQFSKQYSGGVFQVRAARSEIASEWEANGQVDLQTESAFLRLARSLYPERSYASFDEALNDARLWLSDHKNWLLIVDDLRTSSDLDRNLPFAGLRNGHVLITSRFTGWENPIDVPPLDENDAVELLRPVGLPAGAEFDQEAARRLAQVLGGIPRALVQTREFMQSSGSGPEQCIKLFSGNQDLPVILSLKSLLAELRKRDDQGSWLLTLLSFLSPEHIPHTLFDGWLSIVATHVKFNLESDKVPFYEVVARLRQPALVNSSDPGFISINPLVQRLVRESCTERKGWLMSALRLVHRAFSTQPENLLSHAVTVASHAEMEQVDASLTDNTTIQSDLWEGITEYLLSQKADTAIHDSMDRVIALLESAFGGNETVLTVPLNRFGSILSGTGKRRHSRKAGDYLRRSQAIASREDYSRIWEL